MDSKDALGSSAPPPPPPPPPYSLVIFEAELDRDSFKSHATEQELESLGDAVELARIAVDSAAGTGVGLFPAEENRWRVGAVNRIHNPAIYPKKVLSRVTASLLPFQNAFELAYMPLRVQLESYDAAPDHVCERDGHLPKPAAGSGAAALPRCAFRLTPSYTAKVTRVSHDGVESVRELRPEDMAGSCWSMADPTQWRTCTVTVSTIHLPVPREIGRAHV